MIRAYRIQYDADIKKWAISAIDRLRPVVFLGPRQSAGRRFNDAEHVLAILESVTTQATFELYPLASIEGALREAASADYWYEHEKDYNNEPENDWDQDSPEF
jgi:hypothetical protein